VDSDDALRYEDARLDHSRRMRIAGDRLVAVRLAGGVHALRAAEWLRDWLVAGHPVADIRRMLLSPSDRAPSGFVSAGRVVCQCWNVSEQQITSALEAASGDAGARLAVVQAGLKCGTQCGSCTPELRSLAREATAASPRMVA